jgi:hippurate hydrolase
MRKLAALLLLAGCQAAPAPMLSSGPQDEVNAPVKEAVGAELSSLVDLYKWFHQNAELSLKEEKTAAKFAAELKAAGWAVTEKIGGHGIVGVLKNGDGPIVFARIDMDGLPVKEETGLPYASTSDAMHACGHDSHLAIGVGLARVLAKLKDRWSGTMILVGQPAEEIGKGSRMMLDDPKFQSAPIRRGRSASAPGLRRRTSTASTSSSSAAAATAPGLISASIPSSSAPSW